MSNTETLFYTRQGSGPALVLLHGFLEDHSMWDNFTATLAEHATVLCIDLPGHGNSPMTVGANLYDYAQAVFDVLDKENISSAAVAGHSMGGYVALAMASNSRERVDKIMLLNSTYKEDSPARKEKRQQALPIIEENPQFFVRTVVPSLFPEYSRKPLQDIIDELITEASKMSAQAITTATIAMMHRQDQTELFKSYGEKGFLLVGELDTLVDTQALYFNSMSFGSKVLMLPGGHMMPFETIDKVRIFLTNFIL